MLVLLAIRKSSSGKEVKGGVTGTIVFELCDVWTGDVGPKSAPFIGASLARPSKLTCLN